MTIYLLEVLRGQHIKPKIAIYNPETQMGDNNNKLLLLARAAHLGSGADKNKVLFNYQK